jgi:hypothetical protein
MGAPTTTATATAHTRTAFMLDLASQATQGNVLGHERHHSLHVCEVHPGRAQAGRPQTHHPSAAAHLHHVPTRDDAWVRGEVVQEGNTRVPQPVSNGAWSKAGCGWHERL